MNLPLFFSILTLLPVWQNRVFALDKIYWNDGRETECRIIGQDTESVIYQAGTNSNTVSKNDISSIRLDFDQDKFLSAALKERDPEKKIFYLKKSAEQFPAAVQSRILLLRIYCDLKKKEDAFSALALFPPLAGDLAQAYFHLRFYNYPEAAAAVKRAEISSGSSYKTLSHIIRSLIMASIGRITDAKTELEKARRSGPLTLKNEFFTVAAVPVEYYLHQLELMKDMTEAQLKNHPFFWQRIMEPHKEIENRYFSSPGTRMLIFTGQKIKSDPRSIVYYECLGYLINRQKKFSVPAFHTFINMLKEKKFDFENCRPDCLLPACRAFNASLVLSVNSGGKAGEQMKIFLLRASDGRMIPVSQSTLDSTALTASFSKLEEALNKVLSAE
ncbi:MAG TPA: hypothetical protein DC049_04335 [Spirochaetia bacterium]|nr:hypothetical protein [Spirochaetia bacterium]